MSKVYNICHNINSTSGIAFGGGGSSSSHSNSSGYPASHSAVSHQAQHKNLPHVSKDCAYSAAAAVASAATAETGVGAAAAAVAAGNAAYQCSK